MSNEQEKYYGSFHDAITGETITRELTAEEISALLENRDESIEERAQSRLQARESASEKLSALGLTEEEINAIIGGS
jgi:hypothetical protein